MKKITSLLNSKIFTRRLFLIAYDMMAVAASSVLSLLFRYSMVFGEIDPKYLDSVKNFMWIGILITVLVFYAFRLYHSLWAFAGVNEMQNVVTACTVSAAVQGIGLYIMGYPVPRSYYFMYALINIAFTLVSRFFYRFARGIKHKRQNRKNGTSVMIVGAGEAANIIIKEIVSSSYSHMVKAILIKAYMK